MKALDEIKQAELSKLQSRYRTVMGLIMLAMRDMGKLNDDNLIDRLMNQIIQHEYELHGIALALSQVRKEIKDGKAKMET